eukprot:COSAG05_NODE_153_length_15894_cov_27.910415_20_plen_351_part_00
MCARLCMFVCGTVHCGCVQLASPIELDLTKARDLDRRLRHEISRLRSQSADDQLLQKPPTADTAENGDGAAVPASPHRSVSLPASTPNASAAAAAAAVRGDRAAAGGGGRKGGGAGGGERSRDRIPQDGYATPFGSGIFSSSENEEHTEDDTEEPKQQQQQQEEEEEEEEEEEGDDNEAGTHGNLDASSSSAEDSDDNGNLDATSSEDEKAVPATATSRSSSSRSSTIQATAYDHELEVKILAGPAGRSSGGGWGGISLGSGGSTGSAGSSYTHSLPPPSQSSTDDAEFGSPTANSFGGEHGWYSHRDGRARFASASSTGSIGSSGSAWLSPPPSADESDPEPLRMFGRT